MPSTVSRTTPPLSPRDHTTTTTTTTTPRNKRKSVPHSAKPSRPNTLSRRSTPQYITKLGAGRREKERELSEDAQPDDGESFLNYCTYCEKQIDSSSFSHLYCSEQCQTKDLSSSHNPSHHAYNSSGSSIHIPFSSSTARSYVSPPRSPFFAPSDGPDIVPRASPTIPRPRSYFGSEPFPTSGAAYGQDASFNYLSYGYVEGHNTIVDGTGSTALASLRELSSVLQCTRTSSKTHDYRSTDADHRGRLGSGSSRSGTSTQSGSDDDSPTRVPADPHKLSKSASGVWSYMPFASGASKGADLSRTYEPPSMLPPPATGHKARNLSGSSTKSTNYTLATATSTADVYGIGLSRNPGMDRPLPPRSGGYGHRPKSIDLVTPFSGPS